MASSTLARHFTEPRCIARIQQRQTPLAQGLSDVMLRFKTSLACQVSRKSHHKYVVNISPYINLGTKKYILVQEMDLQYNLYPNTTSSFEIYTKLFSKSNQEPANIQKMTNWPLVGNEGSWIHNIPM